MAFIISFQDGAREFELRVPTFAGAKALVTFLVDAEAPSVRLVAAEPGDWEHADVRPEGSGAAFRRLRSDPAAGAGAPV